MIRKITKEKLFNALTILGALFLVFLIITAMVSLTNRGQVIAEKIDVPRDFSRQFGSVRVVNRETQPPDISFHDPGKQEIFWQDFEGDHVLVNFWATWCAPCVLELPSLNKLKDRFEDNGLKVIAISLDKQRSHDQIKAFLLYRGIGDFAAYFDHSGMMERQLGLRGIPTSYLLDPNGNILTIFEGDADWDSPSARQYFRNVLSMEPSS